MATRNSYLVLVAALAFLALATTPVAAQSVGDVAFTQTFCGNWNFGNSTQAGSSSELLLNDASSSGNAYAMGPCSAPSSQDGTYNWKMNHGTVNSSTDFGTEHGQFTYTGSAGDLGAIFDGQIITYKPTSCSGDCTTPGTANCMNVVYESVGNWNSIKNNSAMNLSSTFHSNGTYSLTVWTDNSGNCSTEIDLQPH